jgi:hypothetical protein
MVGTNMIVAFGFTGVSTALTVMSDIEVLDTITWSWTAMYTPSSGYNTSIPNGSSGGGGVGGENPTEIGAGTNGPNVNVPSSPSIAIVAGAVTGGLVVFVLILVAFYMINVYHQKKQRKLGKNRFSDDSSSIMSSVIVEQETTPTRNQYNSSRSQEMLEIKFKYPPSATEPFEYSSSSSSRRPSAQTAHPLQICTKYLPTRSDTIGTSTTVNSSIVLVPSPWTPLRSATASIVPDNSPTSTRVGFSTASDSTDWMIRRAASIPTHHPMQSIASSVSKPDDRSYPKQQHNSHLRRAATMSEISNNNVTHFTKDVACSTPNTYSRSSQDLDDLQSNATAVVTEEDSIMSKAKTCNNSNNNNNTVSNQKEKEEEDNDALFDRQEFILQSDEVAKTAVDDERWSLDMTVQHDNDSIRNQDQEKH